MKDSRTVAVENETVEFDDFFVIKSAEVRVKRPDGEWTNRRRMLSLERGDSVAAVIVDRIAEVALLVRQFRFPIYKNGRGWIEELVAGMSPGEEAPEAAMRREIIEEIGFDPHSLSKISEFYLSPGGSSERIRLYYAEVDLNRPVAPGGGLAESGESTELVTLRFAEIGKRLDNGSFADAKTLVGLQWLRRHLHLA